MAAAGDDGQGVDRAQRRQGIVHAGPRHVPLQQVAMREAVGGAQRAHDPDGLAIDLRGQQRRRRVEGIAQRRRARRPRRQAPSQLVGEDAPADVVPLLVARALAAGEDDDVERRGGGFGRPTP